jgi:peptide/nickel transport system ATP-binding protein
VSAVAASPVEVRNLTKRFAVGSSVFRRDELRAVDDVSFSLRPGTVTALVGESGSGKSTVARLIARLYTPNEGSILFHGEDVAHARGRRALLKYRSHVQMIFQDPFGSLNPVKRVEHHIARPLLVHGIVPRREVGNRVRELLTSVGLVPADYVAQKYPYQLSGGQQQRVAIARYVADEVLVMYAGRIVEQGPTESVLGDPLHAYTKLLLSAVPSPESGLRVDHFAGANGRRAIVTAGELVEARPAHWVRREGATGTSTQ